MATMKYSFYDTATFTNSAKVEHQLFQNRQGIDSTNDKYKTNSRGNGEFPSNESFKAERLLFFPDSDVPLADLEDSLLNSYVQIEYQDRTVFQATLRECVALSSWGGHYSQASAADDALIGIQNDGYELSIPLMFEGGNGFRVIIGQGTALSGTSFTFKFVMVGEYTQ